MTIQELKARAYDLIAMTEQAQMELQKVNEEIARLTQEEIKKSMVEPVEEVREEVK